MAIPDYQSCMLPLLRYAADGQEHQLKDAVQKLAQEFKLTDKELNEFLPSGQQPVFINRIGWARTYLKKAGLLSSPRRGYFQITGRGQTVLREAPRQVNVKYLERFPEFLEFKTARMDSVEEGLSEVEASPGQTPHEALETAYERLRSELAAEILQTLKGSDPALFENIVVELLVKMGYGGSRKDAGRAIGRTGDEGTMESSRKIILGWTTSTSKPSVGSPRSEGRNCRSSPARYKGSAPARGSSSLPPSSPGMPTSTSPELIRRSY